MCTERWVWSRRHQQLLEHPRQRGHHVKRPSDERSFAVLKQQREDCARRIKLGWWELQPEGELRLDHIGTCG